MNATKHHFTTVSFAAATIIAAASTTSSTYAQNPENWISMEQAIDIAVGSVPNSTPIKAEVDNDGPLHFEIKTFTNNTTLWEVKMNPETGSVFDVDDSDGGGAQDKIAEAQAIINVSMFTLKQAIAELEQRFPESFVIEIEMRMRDGVGVFDADLVRGPYRIDVHMRASDGVIVKQQTRLLSSTSDYYNLWIPDQNVNWNTGNLKSINGIINIAQDQFGGKVYDVELERLSSTFYRYEIRILKNNQIIKAKFNARTGALLSQQTITDSDKVNEVKASMNSAVLNLKQAANAAKAAVPNGRVTEGSLQVGDNKKRYEIEFLTSSGWVEVKVNSVTGAIMSIDFGDGN